MLIRLCQRVRLRRDKGSTRARLYPGVSLAKSLAQYWEVLTIFKKRENGTFYVSNESVFKYNSKKFKVWISVNSARMWTVNSEQYFFTNCPIVPNFPNWFLHPENQQLNICLVHLCNQGPFTLNLPDLIERTLRDKKRKWSLHWNNWISTMC